MDQALRQLNFYNHPDVLVNTEYSDDAGIYRLTDDIAMVHTLDFFTPVVDDPYLFGQISAANSVSDIYAMGAKPLNALNIMCFPDDRLGHTEFQAILQGGIDKMHEAGVVVLGGHSIRDNELKYGLAVNGIVHPAKLRRNHSLRAGDSILLTKPIGTGILSTALKNGALTEQDMDAAIRSMALLNREPAEILDEHPVSACTDVTGFGLTGHLWEMIRGTNLSIRLHVDEIEIFEGAAEYARQAMYIPGGTLANIEYIKPHLEMGAYQEWYQLLLCDPQTSGGLLIGLPQQAVEKFIGMLDRYPFPIKPIGEVYAAGNAIVLD